jgi:hypothetical protein
MHENTVTLKGLLLEPWKLLPSDTLPLQDWRQSDLKYTGSWGGCASHSIPYIFHGFCKISNSIKLITKIYLFSESHLRQVLVDSTFTSASYDMVTNGYVYHNNTRPNMIATLLTNINIWDAKILEA